MEIPARERGNGRFFVPFIMAGDPSVMATLQVVDALVAAGADVLELGVPFTDPMADGPVIQAAAERGLRNCPSLRSTLGVVQAIHGRHPKLPIVVFTYLNPLFVMGFDAAAVAMKVAGAAGVLVIDLPPEESDAHVKAMRAQDIDTIFLASPTTTEARLKHIGELSRGFVYYVSRLGVTGVQRELSQTLGEELTRVRTVVKLPIAVGFGIASGAQARAVAALAEGVVVGSAFVDRIAKAGSDAERVRQVSELARDIVTGVRG